VTLLRQANTQQTQLNHQQSHHARVGAGGAQLSIRLGFLSFAALPASSVGQGCKKRKLKLEVRPSYHFYAYWHSEEETLVGEENHPNPADRTKKCFGGLAHSPAE
jgi:hypothetical protein